MELVDLQQDIQQQIAESPKLRGLEGSTALNHAVCGLTEEAGEVAGLLKRQCFRGQDIPRERWVDELGDVLWYLAATASVLDISLDEVWKYNKHKLEVRYGLTGQGQQKR